MNSFWRTGLSCFSWLILAGCADNDPQVVSTFSGGALRIHFAGMVGNERFACGEIYSDVGKHGAMAMGQDLRFFVSDVRLIDTDGNEVPFEIEARDPWQTSEVALLDFEDGTGPCQTSGNAPQNTVLSGVAPQGEYVGIVFSTSVPESLNHQDPTQAEGPLQVTAMQWSWLLGYKFLRAEMKPVPHIHGGGGEGSGSSDHEGHAIDSQFHLGSLACSNEDGGYACNKPNRNELRFESFHPGQQMIVADLGEMMKKVDVEGANHCHGMPNASCPSFYASVGLDFESGEPTSSPTAFRVQER